jgi:hypothetical protein
MRAKGPSDHHLVLCPSGPFLVWWDGRTGHKRQRLVSSQILVKGWSLPAEIEGATLGNVLSSIKGLSRRDLDTLEGLCNARIAPFVREMGTARLPKVSPDPAVTIIEIGKAVYIEKAFEGGKGDAEVVVRPECSGLEALPGRRSRRRVERWALAYQPVYLLKDAVLIIAERSFVTDSRKRRDVVVAHLRPKLTLGEILTALFDEIAFSGTPTERDRERRELDRRVKEARSGKARSYSWAEVKASLKKLSLADPGREERRQAREARLWRQRHPGQPFPTAPAAPPLPTH